MGGLVGVFAWVGSDFVVLFGLRGSLFCGSACDLAALQRDGVGARREHGWRFVVRVHVFQLAKLNLGEGLPSHEFLQIRLFASLRLILKPSASIRTPFSQVTRFILPTTILVGGPG